MGDREDWIVFGSILVLLVALAATNVMGIATGVAGTLVKLAAIVCMGALGPQLYLAATGNGVDRQTRIRFGVVLSMVAIWSLSGSSLLRSSDPSIRWIPAAAIGVLLFGLVAYEFRSGYVETASQNGN